MKHSGGLRGAWDSAVASLRVRELLGLAAVALGAVAIFLPWVYAFSAPSGPHFEVTQVASPNLVDLVLHCGYPILVGVPAALMPGVAFVLLRQRGGNRLKVLLVGSAFVLSFVTSFVFGQIQFGTVLVWDGTPVSASIFLTHGYRVVMVSNAFYLLSLLTTLVWE